LPAISMISVLQFLLIGLFIAPTGGRDWHAQPGDDLQRTINQMSADDQLILVPGEYRGALIIDRRITLVGLDHPLIHGETNGDAVRVTAD